MKNETLDIIICVLLILSTIGNIWFLYLGVNQILWKDDYIKNDIEWCENTNDWIDYSNDLLLELQYYDIAYEQFELTDNVDCWSDDDIEY